MILGFDTATRATAVALLVGERAIERRDDPGPGERPQHASRLLELIEEVFAEAGADWDDVRRIAVGAGPGGFTGLRIGIATARALAQARGTEIVAVSSLHALAAPHPGPVLAVIDARRGEAFAAAWDGDTELLAPAALGPEALESAARGLPPGLQAVGDGTVPFREQLERAGAAVDGPDSPVHRVSAAWICRLGAAGEPADRDSLVPDYRRDPDAKPRP